VSKLSISNPTLVNGADQKVSGSISDPVEIWVMPLHTTSLIFRCICISVAPSSHTPSHATSTIAANSSQSGCAKLKAGVLSPYRFNAAAQRPEVH